MWEYAVACLSRDTVVASLYLVADAILAASLVVVAAKLWSRRCVGYVLVPQQVSLSVSFGALLGMVFLTDIGVIYTGVSRLDVVLRGAAAGVAVVFAFSFLVRRWPWSR